MPTYKTPGVYINEENSFPNSVVPVATTVPAFIGYTEKTSLQGKTNRYKPVRLTSFREFVVLFGSSPHTLFALAKIDSIPGYQLTAPENDYLLYRSLQLFFANGGSTCYIVSVGGYQDPIQKDDFILGIDALLKEAEPTMLVCPEVVQLDYIACMEVERKMLQHCGEKRRNRFAILDIWKGSQPRSQAPDVIHQFREDIGVQNLSFGAAYYPWLQTTIIQDTEITFEHIALDDYPNLLNLLVAAIQKAIAEGELSPEKGKAYIEETNILLQFPLFSDTIKIEENIRQFLQDQEAALKSVSEQQGESKIDQTFLDALDKLQHSLEALQKQVHFKDPEVLKPYKAYLESFTFFQAKLKKKAYSSLPASVKQMEERINSVNEQGPDAKAWHKTQWTMNAFYRELMHDVRQRCNLLPPAAALAGIYSMVDNTRGVFESPANVNLASVIAPAVSISDQEQEDLNVPLNGKAVNAIRTFPGQGVLVWGARTLNGNSGEWRYINVRRTMIFIEQSIKYAMEAYIFETNTANTWVSIKAMVNNFLHNVWAQGGLAGGTPEDAFFVQIGLNETMTPIDILDGYMRMRVGVAVIRPAEFIQLNLQQKMHNA